MSGLALDERPPMCGSTPGDRRRCCGTTHSSSVASIDERVGARRTPRAQAAGRSAGVDPHIGGRSQSVDPFIDGDVLRRNALPHHPMNVFTSINPGRRSSADPLIDVRSLH
jgi:hypothetical protein